MKPPEVSIVVGAYNCGEFIQATVCSVIDQTFKNWELIVVDDCSTDDTYEKVKDMQDGRIRIIRRDSNSGLPAVARNEGIKTAKGKFIAFLDHDDIWFSEKLSVQLRYLEKNTDIGLASCSLRTISPDRRYNNRLVTADKSGHPDYIYDKLLRSNFIACSSVVVRASVLRDIGFFDETPEMVTVEDWDLWLRIARKRKVVFIPEVLGLYRRHSVNLSSDVERLQKALYVIDKHLEKDWITQRQADGAKANFYICEGWKFIDKDIKLARSLLSETLHFKKYGTRIFFAGFSGMLLSAFPPLCRFIKNRSLDRKLKGAINFWKPDK